MMACVHVPEDRKLASVPGTGLLSARGSQRTTDDVVGLKRGTGRSSHIVLIPQPSDDPNDPYVVFIVLNLTRY